MQLLDAVGAVVQHLVRALDREPPLLDVERLLLRVDLLAQRLLRIELGLPLLLLRSSGRLDRVRPLRLALVRELLQAVALEPTLVRQPRLAPFDFARNPMFDSSWAPMTVTPLRTDAGIERDILTAVSFGVPKSDSSTKVGRVYRGR